MKNFIVKEVKYIEGWKTNTYFIKANSKEEALEKINNYEVEADDTDYDVKQSEVESIEIEEK